MSGAPGFDPAESPLARLATRPARDGRPFLAEEEAAAGERLRADFTRGGLTPSVTQRWDAMPRGQGGSPGGGDPGDSALDAKARVRAAVEAVGPELSGLLLDVCCFLKGLETVERERGWPARSAKLLLKAGLAALARHYGLRAGTSQGRIRAWASVDGRPKRRGV